MRAAFLASAAVLCLLTAPAALAEDTAMKVPLKGIDLNTDGGAELALNRIRAAARSFCLPRLELLGARALADCERSMVAKAVGDLAATRVTARYQGRQTTLALTEP